MGSAAVPTPLHSKGSLRAHAVCASQWAGGPTSSLSSFQDLGGGAAPKLNVGREAELADHVLTIQASAPRTVTSDLSHFTGQSK